LLGFDDDAATERQCRLLEENPILPVGPSSAPVQQYWQMATAVVEHKLERH
jgi:hypothetical protein